MIPTGQSLFFSLAIRVNAYTNAKSYAVALTCSFPHQPSHSTPTKLYTLETLFQVFLLTRRKYSSFFYWLNTDTVGHADTSDVLIVQKTWKCGSLALGEMRDIKAKRHQGRWLKGHFRQTQKRPRDQSKWRAHLFGELTRRPSMHSKKKHKSTAHTNSTWSS